MKIATERFGEIEADEGTLLHLKNGLIGLPEVKRVILLEHKPNSPFRWLQDVDNPGLVLPVVDPLLFIEDYPLEEIREALADGDKKPKEIAIAAIATVPPPPGQITVNLVAPVAFNAETRTGDQIVLQDKRFTIRHILAAKDEEEEAKEAKEEVKAEKK